MPSPHDLQNDFRAEVLDPSMAAPVVVDFWAEWCGPCKILGPVLEKLATEAGETWKLVKVDTEAWPDIAQVFRIQAIPTVVMIHQGQPVSQFQGVLPEADVRNWLRENLPGRPPGGLDLAREAFARGDHEQARTLLVRTLAKEPDAHEARSLLVRVLFRSDPEAAATLAGELPAEGFEDLKSNVTLLRDLARWSRGETSREVSGGGEEDLAAYGSAAAALAEGDLSGAAGSWLSLMERNRTLDDDGARRAAVALFDLLGADDPLSREGRRRMAGILF